MGKYSNDGCPQSRKDQGYCTFEERTVEKKTDEQILQFIARRGHWVTVWVSKKDVSSLSIWRREEWVLHQWEWFQWRGWGQCINVWFWSRPRRCSSHIWIHCQLGHLTCRLNQHLDVFNVNSCKLTEIDLIFLSEMITDVQKSEFHSSNFIFSLFLVFICRLTRIQTKYLIVLLLRVTTADVTVQCNVKFFFFQTVYR